MAFIIGVRVSSGYGIYKKKTNNNRQKSKQKEKKKKKKNVIKSRSGWSMLVNG